MPEVITDTDRMAALRRRCLERKRYQWQYHGYQPCLSVAALKASEHVAAWQVRCGLRARDRLAGVRFELDDLELLAGRVLPESAPEAEIAAAARYLDQYRRPEGQNGHCELHLAELFRLGVDGLRDDIRARLAGTAAERRAAYESFGLALEGFSSMLENAAAVARAALASASPMRRVELAEIAESCERIAHRPPTSFHDAIQLLWFADLGVMLADEVWLVVPGHIDRTLWPFYAADRQRGVVTREQALALVESLYLLINAYSPEGLAMSVMVGGRDARGRDVTNELSYLALEALRRTKLVYPTVGVCWHEGTPPDLTGLAVELIGRGYSNPAFFGDATIQRGMQRLGAPPEQSCYYINSTCVEITPAGASNVWVASPYFNTCRILLEEIAAEVKGRCMAADFSAFLFDGSAPVEKIRALLDRRRPASDFAAFLAQFKELLAEFIAGAAQQMNLRRETRRQFGGKPLQSVFTRDCVGRGRDIDDGGALYNWVECSFVGLANLADALQVIREEVFEQKTMTLAELHTLLEADFAGNESVRLRLLNAHAKYGNGDPAVDALVGEIVAFVIEQCARHTIQPDNSPFVPGAFCWIMHERFGQCTGATPDGRRAGTAFADGAGPAQGREKHGPTAAILSTTSWEHAPMIGGLALNLKFSAALFASPAAFARLRDLVLTYLRRGGFETQINVVDRETLRRARDNPEQYRDLIVRIGGYTDYFTRLSPAMQDEVMSRTEFGGF